MLNSKEYDHIENKAKDAGLSKSNYCKQMSLDGECNIIDYGDFSKYITELQEDITVIQQAILTIHKLGQYFPSDIAKIQEFKETVEEHYALFLKESIKISNNISKKKKE